jgi:hypothetical protein
LKPSYGKNQRALLWDIAESGAWTPERRRKRLSLSRRETEVVIESLLRWGLVTRLDPGDGIEPEYRLTPAGAEAVLNMWPRLVRPQFHARLREKLARMAADCEHASDVKP